MQLGTNPAGLNGFALERSKAYTAYDGDIIEVLHGRYLYNVCFEPAENVEPPAAAPKSTLKPTPPEAPRPKRIRTVDGGDVRTAVTQPHRTPTTSASASPASSASSSSKKAITVANIEPNPTDRWDTEHDGQLLVFTSAGCRPSDRIAAYDIDGTIICTRSGNVFPKDASDWQILYAEIPKLLQQYHRNGHKIVFFTNQAGMATGKTSVSAWQHKLEQIARRLSVPLQVFVATGSTIFRKPRVGMWQALVERNGGLPVDLKLSWYVGDAAGRAAKLPQRRKDHSLADRLFAANVGLPFRTPEEHFRNAPSEKYAQPEFDPTVERTTWRLADRFEPRDAGDAVRCKSELQVVLMVGGPGSGKSFVARTVFERQHGFVVINQDELKTWQKCVAALEGALKVGTLMEFSIEVSGSLHRFILISSCSSNAAPSSITPTWTPNRGCAI